MYEMAARDYSIFGLFLYYYYIKFAYIKNHDDIQNLEFFLNFKN